MGRAHRMMASHARSWRRPCPSDARHGAVGNQRVVRNEPVLLPCLAFQPRCQRIALSVDDRVVVREERNVQKTHGPNIALHAKRRRWYDPLRLSVGFSGEIHDP